MYWLDKLDKTDLHSPHAERSTSKTVSSIIFCVVNTVTEGICLWLCSFCQTRWHIGMLTLYVINFSDPIPKNELLLLTQTEIIQEVRSQELWVISLGDHCKSHWSGMMKTSHLFDLNTRPIFSKSAMNCVLSGCPVIVSCSTLLDLIFKTPVSEWVRATTSLQTYRKQLSILTVPTVRRKLVHEIYCVYKQHKQEVIIRKYI